MKNITLQWWNFLVIFLIIFLLGVVVGFMVVPHPDKVAEEVSLEGKLPGTAVEMIHQLVQPAGDIEPVKAGTDIEAPRLITRVEPVYPEIARQARVEGTVICEAETDVYGRVTRVKVLRSIPLLDPAAVDAVKQWVYEPRIIDGEPRGVVFTVTVNFNLK
jgi:TonB family protein